MAELILSSDTLNMGRIKINEFYNSAIGFWATGSTASTQSVVLSSSGNYSYGDYNFIFGKQSSAITGNYGSITGGYKNQIDGDFGHVGCGYKNVMGGPTKYRLISNGKQNIVLRDFASVLNGYKNYSFGYYSTILNGNINKINVGSQNGKYNTITNGYKNNISEPTSKTSFCTIQNGNQNVLYNTNYSIILNGKQNGAIYGKYNTVINGKNTICYGGKYNILNGVFCKNITNTNFNFIFGKGTSSVNPIINSSGSYNVVLGNNGIRTISMKFQAAGLSTSNISLLNGAFNNNGADYGEYFEWEDGNKDSNDRTGFFVELRSGKIKISNSENTIGIVSKTTSYIGDANDEYWSEMFLKDEWGAPIQTRFEKYVFTGANKTEFVFFDDGNKTFSELPDHYGNEIPTTNEYNKENGQFIEELFVNKINPLYEKDKTYIGRNKRKEWTVVGLLGKLRVRTSEEITGNHVDVDTRNGMAKNGTKYHVMEKNKPFDGNYGIVTIFFK